MKRIKTAVIFILASAVPGLFLTPATAGGPPQQEAKAPNLLIDVSAALINAIVKRPVDRTEPVEEVILEAPVSGMSRSQGTVWAELVPDSSNAVVEVVLGGRICSQTVAARDYVHVYTATTTSLEVRRRVVFDKLGIRELPGTQSASSMTQLLEITNRHGATDTLATDIARLGFRRNKEDGEAETAHKSARRASDRLGEDLSPALASASKSVGRALKAIERSGMSLESLDFNTTSAFLQARLRIAAPARSEPVPAPELPADIDVGVRIHESLVNEAAQTLYGGRAFTLNGVNQFYDEVTRGFLRDARKDDDKKIGLKNLEKLLADLAGKPTTITLARKDPLTFAFLDNGFTVEILIASIQQGKSVYSGTRVKAEYRLENYPDGVHLVRKGLVRVIPRPQTEFANEVQTGKKFEVQPASFLVLQEVLFMEILKERFTLAHVPMPEALSKLHFLAPRAGARDGWFALAWNLK